MSADWPRVPLSAVATRVDRPITVEPGQQYRTIGVKWWGEGAYERETIDGAQTAAKSLSLVRAGDLIINKIWVRHGSTAIASEAVEGCAASGEFPTFTLDPERVTPLWVHWMTKTADFWHKCDLLSQGTSGKNRIQPERFLTIEIPLPPLSEQRRIVARVEALAARLAEARRLREETCGEVAALSESVVDRVITGQARPPGTSDEDARAGLLAQATAYRGGEPSKHNNAHPDSPALLSEGPLPLPKGWLWTTLGSVLSHLVDCVNDTPDFAETNTGFLGLKSTNVKPFRLDLSQKWYVTATDFTSWNRRAAPRPGDVVLTREAPMGQSCILPEGVAVCLTQRLMLLRTDERFVHNRFVLYYLNSNLFLNQVRETCRGLTTPHIRVQDAPNFLFPFPPLAEQRRIVAHLDALHAKADAVRSLQAETAAELDALLPAVLARAFAGEL